MNDTDLNVEKQMSTDYEARFELGNSVASKNIVYIIDEPGARGDYINVAKVAVKFDELGNVIGSALLTDDDKITLERQKYENYGS